MASRGVAPCVIWGEKAVSDTLSLVIFIAILAVSLAVAVVVFIRVRRREWLNSLRLEKQEGRGPDGKGSRQP